MLVGLNGKRVYQVTLKRKVQGFFWHLQNSHERRWHNRPLKLPLFFRSGSTPAGYRPPVRDPAGGRN